MRFRYRPTIFLSAFGAALVAILFVATALAPSLDGDVRNRLYLISVIGAGGALIAAVVVSTALAASVEQRVRGILEIARRYAVGDLQRSSPDYQDDEIGEIARAMDGAVQELGRRVDELAGDRTRMVAILASMVEGVLVVDDQGRLQHVNDQARRMLRIDHDAINRTYVEAIRHPEIVAEIRAVLSGRQTRGLEFSLVRDVSRTFVARVTPVISAGRGAVLVLHDITDLRRADQIRRDFVANVSHELRTPLTAIKGYVEALMDEPENALERQRFLDIIQRHTSRMERLVADLLRLARIDAGQELAEDTSCDLESLVGNLVGDFDQAAREKRQTVTVNISPDACDLVVDTAKLHDILRNLIENAIAYTPEGGAIEIAAALTGGRYQITVADNGPGIPAEALTRVFERFFRVDKSRTRPGGTGLGLAIVKNLVSVLHGDVQAANRPGGGAIFTVRLPIRELGAEDNA